MIPRLSLTMAGAGAAALLLAGCEAKPTPEEQAAADARAIAQVEAAQERHPPIQPIEPQPIASSELERLSLPGAGCRFVPQDHTDPVLLNFQKQAVMVLDSGPTTFASDTGGPQGPLGTWLHYVGKALSLRIEQGDGDGVQAGVDALEWPATLTVRDEFDRIVYVRSGSLRCGS